MLAACSSRSPYGGSAHPTGVKLGKPYSIMGQYYEPRYDPNYSEEGMASWYGPGFDGRMTASGERFNTHDLTAAHRTLPMPSLIRITLLSTGKSIVARVNDRGPFKKDRIVDISSAAADELGMKGTGSGRVRVEYLEEATEKYLADVGIPKPDWMVAGRASTQTIERQYATIAASTGVDVHPAKGPSYEPTGQPGFDDAPTATAAPTISVAVTDASPFSEVPAAQTAKAAEAAESHNSLSVQMAPVHASPVPASPADGKYYVQTGSFKTEQNAHNAAKRGSAIAPSLLKPGTANGNSYYRVLLGPKRSEPEAKQMLERARAMGFTDARIVIQ